MLWKVGTIGNIDAPDAPDALDVLDALGNLGTIDNLEYLGNYALFIMHCALRIVRKGIPALCFESQFFSVAPDEV